MLPSRFAIYADDYFATKRWPAHYFDAAFSSLILAPPSLLDLFLSFIFCFTTMRACLPRHFDSMLMPPSLAFHCL